QAEDGIRDFHVTGVQTCALPISRGHRARRIRFGCEWRRMPKTSIQPIALETVSDAVATAHVKSFNPSGGCVTGRRADVHFRTFLDRKSVVYGKSVDHGAHVDRKV